MKLRAHAVALTFGLLLMAAGNCPLRAAEVEAATKPGETWRKYPTRTLAEVDALARTSPDGELDRYGGVIHRTAKATGFFRTEKLAGRWWLVSPDGMLLGGCSFRFTGHCL